MHCGVHCGQSSPYFTVVGPRGQTVCIKFTTTLQIDESFALPPSRLLFLCTFGHFFHTSGPNVSHPSAFFAFALSLRRHLAVFRTAGRLHSTFSHCKLYSSCCPVAVMLLLHRSAFAGPLVAQSTCLALSLIRVILEGPTFENACDRLAQAPCRLLFASRRSWSAYLRICSWVTVATLKANYSIAAVLDSKFSQRVADCFYITRVSICACISSISTFVHI